jgi:hypothetical protein
MSHLFKFRKGWQSEHLAKFILSKISFVGEPSTIADGLGSDFFCTLFKIKDEKYLQPQSSFTIQIKSNKRRIEVTNKTEYFSNLETPFFVGVVNKNRMTLTIYSGETVPHFFAHYSIQDKRVFIKLLDVVSNRKHNFIAQEEDNLFMEFPKVVELNANYDYRSSANEIDELFRVCGLIQGNISYRKSGSYVFDLYGYEGINIYCGPGSAQTFRINFFKRLTEVFYNLKWIYETTGQIDRDEFEIYRVTYAGLLNKFGNLPPYLVQAFSEINQIMTD